MGSWGSKCDIFSRQQIKMISKLKVLLLLLFFLMKVEAVWHKLLSNAEYGGKWDQKSKGTGEYKPLVTGTFSKLKFEHVSGGVSCSNGAPYDKYPWQGCGKDLQGVEFMKNGNYVLQQPNWASPATGCGAADAVTHDIECTVNVVIAATDKIYPTWKEASTQVSIGDNIGTHVINVYGWNPALVPGAPAPKGTMTWNVKNWLCYDGEPGKITHTNYNRVSVGGGSYGSVSSQSACQTSCQNNANCHMYWYNIMNGGPNTCWNWNKKARRNLLALGETEEELSERRRLPSYKRPHQCWYKYGLPWTLAQWPVGTGGTADKWPIIKIVDVGGKPNSLADMKTKCGTGYRLVSIQSAEHVQWLAEQVESQKGRTALTNSAGIPLGYDYKQNNSYYDLSDDKRSVQAIFDTLRTSYGWVGDYTSDQSLGKGNQWYAGFGWNYHGIEDWSPTDHDTSYIICEKEPDKVLKPLYPGQCFDLKDQRKNIPLTTTTVTAEQCKTMALADTDCWKEDGMVQISTYADNKYCYCATAKFPHHWSDQWLYGLANYNSATTCHTISFNGKPCSTHADCKAEDKCTNGVCHPCEICDAVPSDCVTTIPASGRCGCAKCGDDTPRQIGTNWWPVAAYNAIGGVSTAITADQCIDAVMKETKCQKEADGRYVFVLHTNSAPLNYCICSQNTAALGGTEKPFRNVGTAITGTVYSVKDPLPLCPANEITALTTKCKCSGTRCDAGKWCYDGACHDAAKYPACPVSFQTKLAAQCVCATDTTTCAVGQWCYEGTCKSTAKCAVRTENHKNLFYGAKVYGRWNATSKRMYMNFTTPWDISVSSIKWKKTADTTMQYLSASKGLWKVDQTTDPCKYTYNLDVPQTTFFGAGSNFTITGSQLRTNLRVDATENIQVVKNAQTYSYTRRIKNTVPVLVNLVTKTTIAVRFRSTAAPPGPGPAPTLEDFVLFIGAEDNFATDDPHVLITMKVHSRTCVDHSKPDGGVRVKSGADNIKIGSTQTFTFKKDANGNVIAPYEHNLCVEELAWKFYPRKYKENTYEIELEFDLKNLPQKFTTIAAIDIKQGDVLSDIGFTSSIATYNDSNCTVANNKVILGHKFYTKIELTDMIVDAENITCNTYKIKQTKNGNTEVTDMKAELKYAFMEKKVIPAQKNTHICGAELESHHFHVSVDGYDTVLETEILISYDQTNTRRKLISIPLSKSMLDDEMWDVEVGMSDDGIEEVGVGIAQYDHTDQEFRNTKRAPDQDDMIVNLFVETEKSTAVGAFMDQDSSKLFLSMSVCILIVGALGFVFGYTQQKVKGRNSYREIPDNNTSLLVELK